MFTTITVLVVLFAIGRWIIRSLMEPGLGGGGKVDERAAAMRRARAAAGHASSNTTAAKTAPARPPGAPPARPASSPSRSPASIAQGESRPRPSAPRKPQSAARRTEEQVWDWHVELDVPADSSRSEVLAAVKRRLASARASGDTGGLARIAHAAQAGLRGKPARQLGIKIGPRD